MFLSDLYYGGAATEGHVCSGPFILLFTSPGSLPATCPSDLRVLVRKLSLRAGSGEGMRGSAIIRIPGREAVLKVSLCGDFGNDGLPMACCDELWPLLYRVPADVSAAFWLNDGVAGSAAVHDWIRPAYKNFSKLLRHDSPSRPSEQG